MEGKKTDGGIPASIASSSHIIAASASAAGTNSTSASATSALGQTVPTPAESTQDLSSPASPPTNGTSNNGGNVVLPALPTIDITSLVMPTEVAAMGEVVGLHDVPIIVPTKIFFETKPGWSIGTRQNPIAAIKRDKASDPNDKYRIIHGPLVPKVDPTEYQKVILHAAVTITGVLIMIPVRVDGDDNWAITLRAGIAASALGWIRLVSNKTAGRYEVKHPENPENAPKALWAANVSFNDILSLALKGRLITDLNDPVLREQRGAF